MTAGDRFSDDADDRIEWHVDRTRHWVMIGVITWMVYLVGDVAYRVFS